MQALPNTGRPILPMHPVHEIEEERQSYNYQQCVHVFIPYINIVAD